ncbi:hypothetical protein [Rhizobium rhizogenes]|uniref:hypothetical protein n=1 Tax=Rhizobium rhizogenes TaxID=359 RepID=UPI001F2D03AA|nr:hypothetical protein [Rhizobium rhizogenes]
MARIRSDNNRRPFADMVADFCNIRLASVLANEEVAKFRSYMVGLVTSQTPVPRVDGTCNWEIIARRSGIGEHLDATVRKLVASGFDAITRWQLTEKRRQKTEATKQKSRSGDRTPSISHTNAIQCTEKVRVGGKSRAGRKPKLVEEFPEALWEIEVDPPLFADALQMQMLRHGDTTWHLRQAVIDANDGFNYKTIQTWIKGTRYPRTVNSLAVIARIERRYRLEPGYFRAKFPHPARSATGFDVGLDIGRAEKRRLAWHLPEDFNILPVAKQKEIVEWIRRVIISGATDYRRYQSAMGRHRYAIRFGNAGRRNSKRVVGSVSAEHELADQQADPDLISGVIEAPAALQREMEDLLRFKTSTLTTIGFKRNGIWAADTAYQRVDHLGLLFGALVAAPDGEVRGFGLPLDSLSFGLLVFPSIWDWYVQWRERRRGFYTRWEVDMLSMALALSRAQTGWIWQHPELLSRVKPIPDLVSQAEIDAAHSDWHGFCERFSEHALTRQREIDRVARVHRDPFEPILSILEAPSPLGEYRKISEEILNRMPDERLFSLATAEAVRSFLLIRFGLHLGIRQRNMRELLVCPRGKAPTTERRLEDMKRGEIRWSDRDGGWEVLIPSAAFKNSHSSFFGDKPFRLVLPDLQGLYFYVDAYLARHRNVLLADAVDPGTFFVKTVKSKSKGAAYDLNSFYNAWRLTIQRYGVYNPYTGRGAIAGLLPHGPHSVRDVLATHILKQTGSYEQASYAIQDTPDVVAKHYGRFLPQDKAALAAQILNEVWR